MLKLDELDEGSGERFKAMFLLCHGFGARKNALYNGL